MSETTPEVPLVQVDTADMEAAKAAVLEAIAAEVARLQANQTPNNNEV